MLKKTLYPHLILAFFWISNLCAQNPYLVSNVSNITNSSSPIHLIKNNNLLYFFASDVYVGGYRLWKTDGTPQGTEIVKDLNQKEIPIYSDLSLGEPGFISINNILYFSAKGTNGIFSNSLWRTDGTQQGTYLVKNLGGYYLQPQSFVNFNDTLFFLAGGSLWKSDGTDAGTVIVKSSCATSNLTVYNGKLMFSNYHALWESDGTTSGTVLVKSFSTNGTDGPQKWLTYNMKLYFEVNDTVWISDGTNSGTTPLLNNTGGVIRQVTNFCTSNGILYFGSRGYGTDGLWRTNGTQSGTFLVKKFSSIYLTGSSNLTDVNGTLYLIARDSTVGYLSPLNMSLWKSNGTTAGTTFVKAINPNANWSQENSLFNYQNTLYLNAFDSINGYELWKSDGTETGTTILKNIAPNGWNGSPSNFTILNNLMFFTAYDNAHGREIWMSDGTDGGTQLIADINKQRDSKIQQLTKVNNRLFFSATTQNDGDELWISDGMNSGTHMVANIARPNVIGPSSILELNGLAYFNSPNYNPSPDNAGIYKSDGTLSGTQLVKSGYVSGMKKIQNTNMMYGTYPGFWMSDGTENGTQTVYNYISAQNVIRFNNNYFIPDISSKLYISDGTLAGTQIFKTFFDLSKNIVVSNNSMYFFAAESDTTKLWKSDGTIAGTLTIKQVSGDNLIDVNGTLYFYGYTSSDGYGLWKSDGTTAGTLKITSIDSSGVFRMSHFTKHNNMLYFVAGNSTSGYELWKSDGTETGTIMIKDINSNSANAFSPSYTDSIPNFTSVGNDIYFTANDGVHGYELWKTDGTENGTLMVADIFGNKSSFPKELSLINGTLFFTAYDSIHGRSLWANEILPLTNCFAFFSTQYDTLSNTFFLTIDPATVSQTTNFYWDFGDGSSSMVANPSHTYSSDGIYNVCLKAKTAIGDSCVYCHEIGKDEYGNIVRQLSGFTLVTQNGIAGQSSIENENDGINLFPNPTFGTVKLVSTFEIKEASINIYNVLGQKITEVHHCSGKEFYLEFEKQTSGIYFVEIETKEIKWRKKILKTN